MKGEQLLRDTSRAAPFNVIWLPSARDSNAVVMPGQTPDNVRAIPASAAKFFRRRTGVIAALAATTAQAVALALLAASGRDVEPWSAAAIFGLGAVIAAGFSALVAGIFNRRRRAAGGIVPHDALTLALVVAASPFTGGLGAVLLLPAIGVVSYVTRRTARLGMANDRDVFLLLAVLIALAGICESGGWRAWAASAAAVIVGTILRAGRKVPPLASQRPHWHVWMKTSALCIAIASTRIGKAGAMLAAAPLSSVTVLVAGLLYGGGVGIAYNMWNRKHASILTASAPFLAAALECVATGTFPLTKVAAAIVLAVALALSRPAPLADAAPLVRPVNCPS